MPLGHQRGPLGFHIEQLRGDRLGQQRPPGVAMRRSLRPCAVTMFQPRTERTETCQTRWRNKRLPWALSLSGVPQSGQGERASRKVWTCC